eukprot:TRINITY_DN1952_c2_g4_i1.p1 TRINITY_DN1952_c2_g4~~TRINITY_DN1952_c2_g4_i1.p1  ORF type:complete len:532 (-),score=109.85 TRINITY_DN1952_c2_g4_i1:13-1563(-)
MWTSIASRGIARNLRNVSCVRQVGMRSTTQTVLRRSFFNATRQNGLRVRHRASFTPSTTQIISQASPLRTSRISLGARFFTEYPDHQAVAMPALSPTMTEGKIVSWSVKEGDAVAPGDLLCEIETDKAVMSFEAPEDGFLAKILVPGGTEKVLVGQSVCVMVEDEADVGKFADYVASEPKPAATQAAEPEPAAAPTPQAAAPAPPPPVAAPVAAAPPAAPAAAVAATGDRLFASPLARKLGLAQGLDLNTVQGSGPNGRVVKSDVARAAATPTSPTSFVPAPGAAFTDFPNSGVRNVVASRLSQSKQTIPHYYLTVECNVDNVSSLRKKLNEDANGDYKLSINDFIVKASSFALRDVPECNSSWNVDSIRRYHTVDINIAVNTDDGLFTPLISNADHLGLTRINSSVRELAEKARGGALAPVDMQSGTFTISNLGMFGIKQFAAVINPPQACILAVGGTENRVIVERNEEGEKKFVETEVMTVTLSCDHRVVDGAVGAQWLQAFKRYIEDPVKMLL